MGLGRLLPPKHSRHWLCSWACVDWVKVGSFRTGSYPACTCDYPGDKHKVLKVSLLVMVHADINTGFQVLVKSCGAGLRKRPIVRLPQRHHRVPQLPPRRLNRRRRPQPRRHYLNALLEIHTHQPRRQSGPHVTNWPKDFQSAFGK